VLTAARLVSHGHESPLHANELGPLLEKLNRIRYLLQWADSATEDAERRAP
jgi:hypothetical protein